MDCPDETQQQTEQEEQDQLRSVVRKKRNKVVPCGRPLQVQIGDFLEVRPESRNTGELMRKTSYTNYTNHQKCYIQYIYKVVGIKGHNLLLEEWVYSSGSNTLVGLRELQYARWKVDGWKLKLVPKEEFVRLQLTADKVEDLGD